MSLDDIIDGVPTLEEMPVALKGFLPESQWAVMVSYWARSAEREPWAFEGAMRAVAACSLLGERPPLDLETFARLIADGKFIKPASPPHRPRDVSTAYRRAVTVSALMDFGYSKTKAIEKLAESIPVSPSNVWASIKTAERIRWSCPLWNTCKPITSQTT